MQCNLSDDKGTAKFIKEDPVHTYVSNVHNLFEFVCTKMWLLLIQFQKLIFFNTVIRIPGADPEF